MKILMQVDTDSSFLGGRHVLATPIERVAWLVGAHNADRSKSREERHRAITGSAQ